ncbi:histidinol-phosphate transaminase [Amphibacillus sp. Q70]|uniref:histidinol-phosphate transaminase n=1 Tax=Amphibacillus sp. Q70 TaxID=3453416 RepID=UPI003F828A7B
MQPKEVFKSMSPYKPGKQIEEVKREFGLEKIVKLASNENPFGYSKKVDQVVKDEAVQFDIYPDGYATELRQLLSEDLAVEPDQLIFGCGADEVIDIICQTYLEVGTNTIMAIPTFPQYKHNALIQGANIKEIPLLNGYHDLQGMLDAIDQATKVIWLCSPNNPTGCMINAQSMQQFLAQCPNDVIVVLDEAYHDYIDSPDKPNTIDLLHKYPNLILLRTFSKVYGLAGLRVGYGIASLPISEALNIARGPFNTTRLAQQAAIAAYQDQAFVDRTIKETIKNKQAFIRYLEQIGLECYDSEANFVFVKLPVSGDMLFDYLMKNGFIVRSGEALGYPNGVRITIGREEDMQDLQVNIKLFLDEHVGDEFI